MTEYKFKVNDMACANCARTISNAVNNLDGAQQVDTDVQGKTVTVTADAPLNSDQIRQAIEQVGFTPEQS